jgi:hypothetical protein
MKDGLNEYPGATSGGVNFKFSLDDSSLKTKTVGPNTGTLTQYILERDFVIDIDRAPCAWVETQPGSVEQIRGMPATKCAAKKCAAEKCAAPFLSIPPCVCEDVCCSLSEYSTMRL